MRKLRVNGELYVSSPLRKKEIKPGLLVGGIEFRRAYRVLCIDGDDAILRNLRHPDLLEAEPIDDMENVYVRIAPVDSEVTAYAKLEP